MLRLPRALWAAAALSLTALLCTAAVAAAPPAQSKKRADPVRSTILKVARNGGIDEQERAGYLRSWSRGLAAYNHLSGQRRAELGYVIGVVRRLAKASKLGARLKVVFLILDRNREWWSKSGPPGSGARLRFGGSRVIFQYFPGKGLQFHPLANFGQANGYWYGRKNSDLRSLLDDLVSLSVERSGFLTWEYYFDYGGGSPPWISGMAQGTAMQALARAGSGSTTPSLPGGRNARPGRLRARDTDRRARRPRVRTTGTRSTASRPSLNVLNGHAPGRQRPAHLRGVRRRPTAQQLFERRRPHCPRAASRASTPAPGRSTAGRAASRAPEANLNYHTLNRDFARNLCRATNGRVLLQGRRATSRTYLKEDPSSSRAGACPSPARRARACGSASSSPRSPRGHHRARPSRDAPTSPPARTFWHGERYFRWVPPRAKRERTYTFKLFARDLAGQHEHDDRRRARAAVQAVAGSAAPRRIARGDTPHDPLYGQRRGRKDQRRRRDRPRNRPQRAAHRRALDRPRAQPVRLAGGRARAAAGARRRQPLGTGGAGRGGAGAQLAGGAALAVDAACRPRRGPDPGRGADRAAGDGRDLLAAAAQEAPCGRASST